MDNTLQNSAPLASEHEATNRLLRWWRDPAIRFPVLVFIVARLVTVFVAYQSVHGATIHNIFKDDPIFLANLDALRLSGPVHDLIEPWDRWDTGWYMKVAVHGYAADDGSIIFGPMFPALSAGVGWLVGDTLLGGLLVSSVSCLIFLLVFYRLARGEANGSDSIARNAVLLLIAVPTAFYMLAAYTESTFMAFTALAMLAARNRHWWLAAAAAMVASLTRLQGWVLIFPIGYWAFLAEPRFWAVPGITVMRSIREAVPRLVAMGSGGLMTFIFLEYTSLSGLGTVDGAYAQAWGMNIRPPWESILTVLQRVASGQAIAIEYANLIALGIIVLLFIGSLKVLPLPYHLYMGVTLILVLMRYYPPQMLNGTMRYVLDFFPLFIALAIVWDKRPRLRMLWFTIGILVGLTMLFLFVRWLWIA